MIFQHIRLIVWKEFSHIRADPLLARLLVVPVFILLFVIGYALTTDIRHVRLAFVDYCNSSYSRSLVHAFESGDIFDVVGKASSIQELRRLLDNSEIAVGLIIPPTFASNLERHQPAHIELVFDGTDANQATVARGYATAIISRWSHNHARRILTAMGLSSAELIPVHVNTVVLYNPHLISSWYMIPGTVVLLVTIITGLLSGLSLVREKERGTFEQLVVTPIHPISLLAGKIIPFVVIGVAEVAIFMVGATLWFRIPFRGSVLTVAGFTVIYMMSSLSIGVLTSSVSHTSQQVLFLTFFILLFFLLLSGLFIPVENMPHWVQALTFLNPLRFFMGALREIFLKGFGFRELWREAVCMSLIGLMMLALALGTFQRRAR